MESNIPRTQGRGPSRFSKALPLPPESPLPISKDKPPAQSISTSSQSPLPPIPEDSASKTKGKMSKVSIRRRPVGGEQSANTKTGSVGSVSSVYSDSPGFSRSLSNNSYQTKDSPSGFDSEPEPTPPLPPKDSQRPQPPTTPNKNLASSAVGFQASPPRPEIWRRRSVKSDRSIAVPELKLEKSNGSTASPPQQPPQDLHDLPPAPSRLPRSLAGRKPVAATRPAPPQPDGMGSKLSKLKAKNKSSSEGLSKEDVQSPPYPTFARLPTPEYLKTDKQQPITPQVLSPAPGTPPHDVPPQLPPKSESRRANATDSVLANTTNRPNLLSSHSPDPNETLTVTSESAVMRSPQPQKTYATKILTPQPSPPPTQDKTSPLVLPSPVAGLVVRFPKPTSYAPEGSIFQGPELGIVHFDCYQSHKLMRNSQNKVCPMACMICRKQETGLRWRCTWCCLSACGACMQVLTSIPEKDLRLCLERIGKR